MLADVDVGAVMGTNPAQIGPYTVERALGSGGMGEVFLAYSPAGSPVAVKVIRSDKLDEQARARFEREALIARTVIGTNRVARFLDADPYADRPWLAMEYVPGRTLLQYVKADGVLPLPLVASLGALLAEGLAAVHTVGLLHRDLKPQNIILGADGPMIIDFGLAALIDASQDSLSQSGQIIGTIRCMPPEQAGGRLQVTAAADVYALGTVLMYAVAGHYPYDGVRWEAIAAQITNPAMPPDLGGVAEPLVPLLESMLAHEPEARPTVAEISAACLTILAAEGVAPHAARLALIGRTTTPDARKAEWPLPANGAAGGLVSTSGESPGPLDVPPRVPDEPEPVPSSGGSTPSGPGPKSGSRRPASLRVAEELRVEYAAQSSL